ncbi:hypothetical protein [Pseudomonas sp. NPDC007930]|uniref:hypothetical protein n=1 Tax=Pseudomonas sp. NPDC007930 TaxID=3364417 RepID=UPI0036EAD418
MVSAQYLANFRAERASRQAQARNLSRDVDQQWINGWDGRHRYLAQWVVVNNAIDGGSVCENQGRGSIDYRECRKGAKVFFRDQCRAWAARAAQEQQTWSDQMKDRYCHAESGFNPLG